MMNRKMTGILCTAFLIAAGSAAIADVLPDWCNQEVQVYFEVLSRNMENRESIRLPDLMDCRIFYKGILYIMRYFIMRCGFLVFLISLCFKRQSCICALLTGMLESVLYTIFAIMIFTACSRVSFFVWFLIGLLPESMISLCIYCSFRELWDSGEIRFHGKLIKPAVRRFMSPYLHCRIIIILVLCCLFEGFCYRICA